MLLLLAFVFALTDNAGPAAFCLFLHWLLNV
jgi:hypothetical protein